MTDEALTTSEPGEPHGRWPSHGLALSYVLVADADSRRIAACIEESANWRGGGVVIARDGEDAAGLIRRFGPPRLLIADLALPGNEGFAVIDSLLRVDAGRSTVIAWAATRGLREFASHRWTDARVKVLGASAGPAVLRNAFAWAQRTAMRATAPPPSPFPRQADELPDRMTELAEGARHLSGAAGVAVYFKAPGDAQFRVSVSWASELPMPPSPDLLPRVFEQILKSGDAVVWPDQIDGLQAPDRPAGFEDVVRGLAAVPVIDERGEMVGAIFLFDVKPLGLSSDELTRLKALGRSRPPAPQVMPAVRADRSRVQPLAFPPELLDRRHATLAFARELARVRRERLSLSVVLFDVSPVERSSEAALEDASQDAGLQIGEALARGMRGSDLAVQWDRQQLLVVLTGLSEIAARPVAERLRAALQAGARNRVAASGGVAEFVAGDTFEDLVARAHERLQSARARGENRIA